MRLRLGLVIAAILATLLSPISPQAHAFGGFASAPNSVTQTAVAGGIRVTWSAPTDVDSGITGYRVEYSTTGTNGTWTLSTTTSSATYTYDILGLSQVATYVRVAALTNANANIGMYGYPWAKLYSTSALRRNSSGNVTYDTGFGLSGLGGQASNTYASANYTRVKYRIDTTISSVAKFAEADFYTWPSGGATGSTTATTSPTIAGLAVPSVNSGQQWVVQANVADLNVYSDNTAVTKTIRTDGRLEIWPWDYGWGPSGQSSLSPSGSSSSYDYDDLPSTGGSFGSFQLHDLTNSKPVFVWNNTGYSNSYSAEVGYGLNSGSNPDWTFCSQGGGWGSCPTPTSFKLQIYINPSITPLADATPPTVTRIDSRFLVKNADTITVQSNEIGTVYLVNQVITVTNLASITAAATANKNSVSISAANTNTTMTIGWQSDGLYNLYAADSAGNISTAVLATIKVDNTAPTASSIAVNSAGTAILLTASETITNSAQILNYYTVSDSGSAISITATSFSGSVATLTLSRAIPAGATVYFTYNMGAGAAGGRWIDQAGNEMSSIALRTITNNSTSPISVVLTVPNPLSKGISITMSAAVSVAGKVTFTIAGKRIVGCLNKVASGTTPITVTCTFKPALTANQTIKATLVPTLGAYPTTVAAVDRFILKRTTTR